MWQRFKFPYQATNHCISSTNPTLMGNTPGWAATPQDNFHRVSSSPKILHVTEILLLWLQYRACRCSTDAARVGSEVENRASAVTNMTGLDLLLLESAEECHCVLWQQCWLTKAYPLQANSHNDLKKKSMKCGLIFLSLLRFRKRIHQFVLLCPARDALPVKARCSHAGQHRTHRWLLRGCALCKGVLHCLSQESNFIFCWWKRSIAYNYPSVHISKCIVSITGAHDTVIDVLKN